MNLQLFSFGDNKQNIVGIDSSSNKGTTTNITSNRDGSIAERTEYLIQLLAGAGATSGSLPASGKSIVDIIGTDGAVSLLNLLLGTSGDKNAALGQRVTKVASDILDGTTQSMFTVAGGKVLITNIILEVSVAAVDAGANNTKITLTPTVGTAADLCAVLDVDGDEAGSIYSITGTFTDALQGGSGGGATGMNANGVIVPEGTIDLISAADGGVGGALISAEVWYIPLDSGATVTST